MSLDMAYADVQRYFYQLLKGTWVTTFEIFWTSVDEGSSIFITFKIISQLQSNCFSLPNDIIYAADQVLQYYDETIKLSFHRLNIFDVSYLSKSYLDLIVFYTLLCPPLSYILLFKILNFYHYKIARRIRETNILRQWFLKCLGRWHK